MTARYCAVLTIALAGILAAADHVGATTIIPMSDRDLATSSRAIVEGTIVASEAVDVPDREAVFTYITVDVERVIKGGLPVGQIVLRQLGGITEKRAFVVHATPSLDPGDRVLLFLNTDDDGSLHVAHLKLGAYHVIGDASTGLTRVSREMGEGYLNPITRDTITWSAPYDDFLLSVDLILQEVASATGLDERSLPPLRLSPPEYAGLRRGTGAAPAYAFLGAGFRWFEPDTGESVRARVNNKLAFTPSLGIDEVKQALRTWSSVSGSALKAMFDGTTMAGGLTADGVSSISYGDPKHQIDDLVNCQGAVALASIVGNPGQKKVIGNLTFSRLVEGDLTLNNGIECITNEYPLLLEEILTHEFGHDLGLGHSSERFDEPDPLLREATMYFIVHNDGRGSVLQRDDSDAIRFLYSGPNGPLVFRTDALPDAVLGQPYDRQLDFGGGTSPYTVSIVSGGLPPGITISSAGRITGTSNVETTASVTIRVADSDLVTMDRSMSLRVSSSPAPFVEKVKYTGSKLQITGLFLDAGAIVTVNGTPTIKVPKYKPSKSMIVVNGSASSLNLRRDGTDVIVVTIGGLSSNAYTF